MSFDTDQKIEDLIKKLFRKETGLRIYACNKLGELGAKNAIPSLTDLICNDNNQFVRAQAVTALGKIGFKDSLKIIREVISSDKNSIVRKAAIKALWEINSFNETSFLIERLRKDSSSDVRSSISLVLAKNNVQEVIIPIKEILSNSSNNEEKFAFSFALILLEGLDSKGIKIIEKMQKKGVLNSKKINQFNELVELLQKSSKSQNQSIQFENILGNKIYPSFVENINEILHLEESNTIEFKASLRWNMSQKEVNKDFEKKRIETIAAFMNSQGGSLIIGITDSKQVVGINKDYLTFKHGKRNQDGFELHLTELIKKYIGSGYRENINVYFEKYQEKEICCISVYKCIKPVFILNCDFIIREGNRNQKLTPKETTEYIERHWSKISG